MDLQNAGSQNNVPKGLRLFWKVGFTAWIQQSCSQLVGCTGTATLSRGVGVEVVEGERVDGI